MAIRFRIGDLLVVIALVALPVAFFAPELRSMDRNALAIFAVVGVITAVFGLSFTPVWIVLLWSRRRLRRGLGFRAVDYLILIVAFLLSLGIFLAIFVVIRLLVGG
jgi:cyanate permease